MKFNWRKMRCKLVDKVLKTYLWIWCSYFKSTSSNFKKVIQLFILFCLCLYSKFFNAIRGHDTQLTFPSLCVGHYEKWNTHRRNGWLKVQKRHVFQNIDACFKRKIQCGAFQFSFHDIGANYPLVITRKLNTNQVLFVQYNPWLWALLKRSMQGGPMDPYLV